MPAPSAPKPRPRPREDKQPFEERKASPATINVLGAYLLIVGTLTLSMLVELWPAVETVRDQQRAAEQVEATVEKTPSSLTDSTEENANVQLRWLGKIKLSLTPDAVFVVLALVFGALGALIHASISFVDYVGNRRLAASWLWWYAFRPFIGASLALVFYVALRAGFFAPSAGTADINHYGIAALAGLAGMFSKQASDKLREIFDTLFRTAAGTGDEARSDSLTNPSPTLLSVDPPAIAAGSEAADVVLHGRNFLEESTVLVNDSKENVTTSFVSATELEVTLGTPLLAEPRQLEVKVSNPEPGGGMSETLTIEIEPGGDEG